MTQMSTTCLAADLDGQLFVTRVTRRVPLVEQELLPHPKAHDVTPDFQWGSCCSIFSFQCVVLQIVVCPFVPFHLASVLFVLRFTGQIFGIFKLTYELSLMTRSVISSFYYSIRIPTSPPHPMQPLTSIFFLLMCKLQNCSCNDEPQSIHVHSFTYIKGFNDQHIANDFVSV